MKFNRNVLAALALSATMLALAGCGSSSVTTNTLAPSLDTTPPTAPTNVHGSYDPHYIRDYVSWDLSASSDVASYEVWQYTADPATGAAGVKVGEVVASVNELLLPASNTGGTQWFRVRAIDTSANKSAYSATGAVEIHGDGNSGSGSGGIKDGSVF